MHRQTSCVGKEAGILGVALQSLLGGNKTRITLQTLVHLVKVACTEVTALGSEEICVTRRGLWSVCVSVCGGGGVRQGAEFCVGGGALGGNFNHTGRDRLGGNCRASWGGCGVDFGHQLSICCKM